MVINLSTQIKVNFQSEKYQPIVSMLFNAREENFWKNITSWNILSCHCRLGAI